MVPPPFLLKRAWKRKYKPHPSIRYLSRENVVMHMSSRELRPSAIRTALGTRYFKTDRPQPTDLGALSSADLDSPFMHLRFNNGRGKILYFLTNRNVIRAGKSTHADAFLGIVLWLLYQNDGWYSSIAAPNSVVSGQFTELVSEDVKTHHLAAHSSKFPGISLNLQNGSTPELYLRRATFIIPGIRNADQLASAIDTLGKIHGEYSTGKAPPPS